jgi:hypothetical protein
VKEFVEAQGDLYALGCDPLPDGILDEFKKGGGPLSLKPRK